MKQGDRVILTKVFSTNLAKKLPEGYWLKGFLLKDVEVGKAVEIDRYARSALPGEEGPQEKKGKFISEPLSHIYNKRLVSINSTWIIDKL